MIAVFAAFGAAFPPQKEARMAPAGGGGGVTDRLIDIGFQLYIVLGFAFIFAPIVSLIVFAFNGDRFPSLPWKGLRRSGSTPCSRRRSSPTRSRTASSWGGIVAVIATFLGGTAAYSQPLGLQGQGRLPGNRGATAVHSAHHPRAGAADLPEGDRAVGSLTSVVISHVVLASAFALGIVRMRLTEMDATLEEAAWNLGASQWRTIKEVVLPQAWPRRWSRRS